MQTQHKVEMDARDKNPGGMAPPLPAAAVCDHHLFNCGISSHTHTLFDLLIMGSCLRGFTVNGLP